MPQADAEDRFAAQQVADRLLGIVQGLGIAGAVREEHPVGPASQHVFGRCRARQDRHAAAHVEQVPGDVPLHAVIQCDDVRRTGRQRGRRSIGRVQPGPRAERLGPLDRPRGNHLADQVAADQAGAGIRLGHQAGVVQVDARQDALHGAANANAADQCPGVDPLEGDDAVRGQVAVQLALGAEVARSAAQFPHDEPRQVRLVALDVLGRDAVVADLRIGHRNDLPAIAGIGQDLLISGHRRVEADFPVDFTGRPEGRSGEDGSVFQGKFCDRAHSSP